MSEKKPFERLPTDVIPRNYAVELQPDLKKFVFTGKLAITVEVKKATKTVVLNSADIEVSSAKCGDKVATVSCDKDAETLTLDFPIELSPGLTEPIEIEYCGTLNDQMKGFYRSKYFHPSAPDEERYAAVTQFEATDARRALPCWDEPAHKATFDVTLVVPKDRVALSNMDEKECTELPGDLKRVVFNRTPIMSTYLLAFIVGEYEHLEETDSNGVLVRVFAPIGKKEHGRFALDVALKTLPFYTEYFKVPYPLPKMDLIAIADFAAGAMENWGLITYRDRLLLVDPKETPEATKQVVAIVVGHEIAHQWFGNLVTMEWWTDLWLNEGFASWIEYLCVDNCHPEYDIWTQFLSKEYAGALSLDALSNSHPIEVEVGPPSEVEEIFDAISYSKGASIIRMLHHWIGDEDFRKGMNSYLTKFKLSNAKTRDLWESLEKASGKPVAAVMTTWTKQMGYPVLSVEAKQDMNKCHLTVTQSKFCADGDSKAFADMLWRVPVTVSVISGSNQKQTTILLEEKTQTITLDDVCATDAIKLNPGQYGFYRVNYTPEMFDSLRISLHTSCTPGLSDSSLPPQDRMGLQNDAFALARSGVGSTVEVLRLFQSFVQEINYTVWESLVGNLSIINQILSYTDFHDQFKEYAEALFAPTVARLKWESEGDEESPLDTMLRSLALGQACRYGNTDAITEAQARFVKHVSKTEPISSDIRGVVYGCCMENGDESIFEQLMRLHDETDSSDEKNRIYRSLGKGKSENLKKKCLELTFSDKVRTQDAWGPLASTAGSGPLGRQLTWDFIKDNWSTITKKFQGSFLLSRILEVCTSGFVGRDKADEIEQFFKDHPVPTAERAIKQSVEAIRMNTAWLERDRDSIKAWLKAEVSSN